ncbi:hypothetical protein TNCV_2732001 [Trichonephila clavipes]|nr:hypothetical protein TNCV_2732001 [Trichonephila clavipes]
MMVITAEFESGFVAEDYLVPFRCSPVSSCAKPLQTEASKGGSVCYRMDFLPSKAADLFSTRSYAEILILEFSHAHLSFRIHQEFPQKEILFGLFLLPCVPGSCDEKLSSALWSTSRSLVGIAGSKSLHNDSELPIIRCSAFMESLFDNGFRTNPKKKN